MKQRKNTVTKNRAELSAAISMAAKAVQNRTSTLANEAESENGIDPVTYKSNYDEAKRRLKELDTLCKEQMAVARDICPADEIAC